MYFVYLIERDCSGIYKIGKSKDVSKRLLQLQTSCAEPLHVISTFKSNNGSIIEKTLHRKFSNKKISGEWFELKREEIVNFKLICLEIDNNISFLKENSTKDFF